ncbi:MAG: DUF4177 domain-containing protein [Corallococcus sp.]|nr:DUF4177 domain-containing protein [Corallococcus sp.]
MKKYEYVPIRFKGILKREQEEHREIIDRYAANGYRYVGYVPVLLDADGGLFSV